MQKSSAQFGQRKKNEFEIQDPSNTETEDPIYMNEEPKTSNLDKIDKSSLLQTKKIKLSADLSSLYNRLFERIINQIDLALASRTPRAELKRQVEGFVSEFIDEQKIKVTLSEQQQICEDLINEMIGLGPLEILVTDPNINDIMVNRFDRVFVEQEGKLYLTDVRFRDPRHVMQIAQRIANMVGRRVDETSPMVDARLKDGSRVNIIIPPLALDGVSISIRKFSQRVISLEEMVKNGNISKQMLEFLEIITKSRLNVIISGGTGAGKTTLLNALSQLIAPGDRIVTIEDSAELKLEQPHVVRLESRPANIEGEGEIQIRDLLRNALRMRPDRIVIGECRGAEAFDMLQAMNTGHDGSMSTLHANSAGEALHRLENMVLMAGFELPTKVIRSYIADAVDLIIQVARMRDGIRRVVQIAEVYPTEDGDVKYQDLFVFKYKGMDEDGKITGTFDNVSQDTKLLEKVQQAGLDDQLKAVLKKSVG
jgi:pilus assembly protein CpaF